MIWVGRAAVVVGVGVVGMSVMLGTLVGLASGYFRGLVPTRWCLPWTFCWPSRR